MPLTRRTAAIAALAVVLVGGAVAWYTLAGRGGQLPEPGSDAFEQVTRSFYRGLAAVDVGLLDNGARDFEAAGAAAPAEPAVWANLGLTRLRLGELDAAAEPLERATTLAPDRADLWFLRGRLETARGRIDEGIAHLRRAAELDPGALQARFALAEEIERAAAPGADDEAQRTLDGLLEAAPDNLAVLLERTRVASKRADLARIQDSVRRLEPFAASWPPIAAEQFTALRQAAAANAAQDAARATLLLRNVLLRVPAFLEDLADVKIPAELFADPLTRFIRLPSPRSTPAPPDSAIAFVADAAPDAASGWNVALAFPLDADAGTIVRANATEVRFDNSDAGYPIPGGMLAAPMTADALLPIDWNHDFRTDLFVAGAGGVRLLLQDGNGRFTDATERAAAGSPAIGRALGAWAADVEMDGDLDIVLGAAEGSPTVLRNNGDGTWRVLQPFGGVSGARGFAWGDVDRDGDPDAVLLDANGGIAAFLNRQAGQFDRVASPEGTAAAMTLGDVNSDGAIDVVTLGRDGSLQRLGFDNAAWQVERIGSWQSYTDAGPPGIHRLILADLDNNGAVDVIGSGPNGSAIWLATETLDFRAHPAPAAQIFSVTHLDRDGRLDLVGVADNRVVRLRGQGQQAYHWQVIRPRAQPSAGDQRINSFGVGGEVEVRSGLLVQKHLLTGGPVHVGLGDRTSIDVARIVWPNGVPQAEFDVAADGSIVAEQRLKGSCPWVFTYDGTDVGFVSDFLWRSPLGLRINAQDTAGVTQTEDWIKIRGDQLAARDGAYDVRITAELWETHYVDHVGLMAVDHPADVDVWVDERFSRESPALKVHGTTRPRPVARAWDHHGRDVTAVVATRDGQYLAAFERGKYQGVAAEHFVEFEAPDGAGPSAPGWLLAHGWIYPTDSSINVAIGQSADVQPRGLSLEAQDAGGRWVTVAPDLGFPAGKNKTILIDLTRAAGAGISHPQRWRLRTNLEIYWDWLATASRVDDSQLRMARRPVASAQLRYRGFSHTEHPRAEVPETPLYDRLANVGQRWRDLTGYYTRFGDVKPLVAGVDDRYVIMNAGDELQLRFEALPEPPAGWTRDYVLIGDGWNKDGDFNTTHSSTVEPLPSHGDSAYAPTAVADLAHDSVFRRHHDDWLQFHTRFVTPRPFLEGLGWIRRAR